jgi:hypothetical protein
MIVAPGSGVHAVDQLDHGKAAYHLLRDSIRGCTSLRAAVAFWTLDPTFLGPTLLARLGDGYLVVDLQLPTNIRTLDGMNQRGANVFIHLGRAAWSPGTRDAERDIVGWGTRETRALMHSKVWLFDFGDGRAEIWTGSLNATNPAVRGVNLEGSLVLQVDRGCPVYEQTVSHLEFARSVAERFQHDRVAEYLTLQGATDEDEIRLIQLEGYEVDALQGQAVVVFLGLASLRVPASRAMVYVLLIDTATEQPHLYRAEVLQSGSLAAANRNAGGTSIQGKRYAVQGRGLAALERSVSPPQGVVDDAFGWVTLDLVELRPPGSSVLPVLGEEAWAVADDLPIFRERLRPDDRDAFGPDRLVAKEPAWQVLAAAHAPTLQERRLGALQQSASTSLFSRYLLKSGPT